MNAHTPYCETCQDEPAFARCPDCGTIPAHIMADLCREPLRQLAHAMCERAAERQLTDVTVTDIGDGWKRAAA